MPNDVVSCMLNYVGKVSLDRSPSQVHKLPLTRIPAKPCLPHLDNRSKAFIGSYMGLSNQRIFIMSKYLVSTLSKLYKIQFYIVQIKNSNFEKLSLYFFETDFESEQSLR